MVLATFPPPSQGKMLRVLATSGTEQGIDSLRRGPSAARRKSWGPYCLFSFDAAPDFQAFARFTRNWRDCRNRAMPGFLISPPTQGAGFHQRSNIREELWLYRHSEVFRAIRSERIWAISPLLTERFARIFEQASRSDEYQV
jgi:hypothetical protein